MKRLTVTILTLFMTLSLFAQKVSPDFMDGAVYFQLKPDYPLQLLSWDENDRLEGKEFPFFTEVFSKYGVEHVLRPFHLFGDEGLLRIIELHFVRAQAVDSLLVELQQSEWVSFAEKIPFMKPDYLPNDPYYGIVNGRNWKWHLDMIKADSAWNIQRGKAGIKVAIVDNFVWGNHPDLQIDSANLCTVSYKSGSYKYTVGTATPPVRQGSTDTAYDASHGTHCAGLVGAINSNGEGIASIGGGVTLMGISATNPQYLEYISYSLQGVQWAAEHGADVISMSFSSANASQAQTLMMQTCYNKGIVLVASAGNDGDKDNSLRYPAVLPTVISVASVDGDGKLSYFSEWGPGRADIAAPGGYIGSNADGTVYHPNMLSTTFCESYYMKNYGFSGTYYDGMQGTSMSCPVVSGLVGLMLSKDSTLSPAAVKQRLQATATPLNSASKHVIDGYGYINAYKALMDEYLMVYPDSLFFPKGSGVKDSIQVIASKSWTLTGLPSWLSASMQKGDSGKTTIVFTTLTENSHSEARICQLLLKGEGKAGSKLLTVTQHNYPYIFHIDKKKVRFPSLKGHYDTLHVLARYAWTMQNGNSWLATDIQKIKGDSSIVVLGTRTNNNAGSNREALLIFTSDRLPNDTVYVVQHKPDFITLSAAEVNIGAVTKDTVSVNVFSNVKWQLTGGDSTWIFPDKTAAEDSSCILLTAQSDNTTGDYRTANYAVSNGKITKNFTVKQLHNVMVIECLEDRWTVSPNPTDGQVVCRFPEAVATEVCVYDARGRLLKTHPVEGEELLLDFSDFAPGVYLLKYGSGIKQIIRK